MCPFKFLFLSVPFLLTSYSPLMPDRAGHWSGVSQARKRAREQGRERMGPEAGAQAKHQRKGFLLLWFADAQMVRWTPHQVTCLWIVWPLLSVVRWDNMTLLWVDLTFAMLIGLCCFVGMLNLQRPFFTNCQCCTTTQSQRSSVIFRKWQWQQCWVKVSAHFIFGPGVPWFICGYMKQNWPKVEEKG